MTPIRILHLDSERSWRGGERQVLELIRRQRAGGDEPILLAPARGALYRKAAAEGFSVEDLPMRGTWDLASVAGIARLVARTRPDVVHWHAARAHALGAMAALVAPGPKRVLSRRVDFPVRRTLGSRILYALPIDAIAAISDGVRMALVKSGVPEARIHVVPSGVDLAPFDAPFDRPAARAKLGIGPGDVLALQVAALAPHKSQTTLLKAAALLGDRSHRLRIWIAGEGPLRDRLLAEHARLNLGDRVRFLGFCEDVTTLLRAADLFVMSSVLEGLGTSIIDAMAAGLPVVATRVGGIPEVVLHGETGLLVSPEDSEALAAALSELAADAKLRERLGAAGRVRAREFGADRTAAATRALYEDLLARVPGLP